jgi:hypothetical protein
MYAGVGSTTICGIIDHGRQDCGGQGLQALEGDGLWVAHRQGQRLQVLAGSAWVTFAGGDFVLRKGDRLKLSKGRDPALVSAVGAGLTILEVI